MVSEGHGSSNGTLFLEVGLYIMEPVSLESAEFTEAFTRSRLLVGNDTRSK